MIELHLDRIESWKVSPVGVVLRNFLSFFWQFLFTLEHRMLVAHRIPLVDCLTKMSFLLLTLQDKPSLFKSFFRWLKPGGKVLISDYCKSPGKPSEVFAAYIKQRGYDLHDVEAYGQVVLSSYLILFLCAWLMLNIIALI